MHISSPRSKRSRSVATIALIVSVVTAVTTQLLSGPASAAARSARTGTTSSTTAKPGYDLVTASGAVRTFGGATFHGSTQGMHLSAPVVDMAVDPAGTGYWLAGSDGGVFSFGTAKFHGSLGAKRLSGAHAIIAIISSPTGLGYWLIDASGDVTPFGDATAIGSLPASDLTKPIVGAAVNPQGTGAWFTNSAGDVYTLGKASAYGSLAGTHLDHPIVSLARTPDGKGYWLAESDGDVFAYGDAGRQSAPAPSRMMGSIVGITAATGDAGFWATTDDGWVLPGGDVHSLGGINAYVDGSPIVAIAGAAGSKTASPDPLYPTGSIGYDISWPQCATTGSSATGSLPGPPRYPAGSMSYTVAVLGVDGWAVGADNSCLSAEVQWAKRASYKSGSGTPAYELYLFLNSPAKTSTIDATGPAGTCSKLSGRKWERCLAYNYGYNSGVLAIGYANSEGAHSSLWWLDVENDACAPGIYNQAGNGEFWSCDQVLNSLTIQGAINALRSHHISAGIYSTAQQYRGITGGYVPSGPQIPIWIAGAYWTSPPYPANYHYSGPSVNRPYCAAKKNSYAFAGGKPVLLQETPGPNNYPFDPDLAC